MPADDDPGNLALLYLTCSDGRVDREEIDLRDPNLISGLLDHPGVGIVMVRSALDGPIALGREGRHDLATGRVTGIDPLLPFGPLAAQSLRRLDGFQNTGDLVVIGPCDAKAHEVVSYEELVGSHGGLGGWQVRPFLLHPVDLQIVDAPLIGAVAVHRELKGWLGSLRAAHPPSALATPAAPSRSSSRSAAVRDRLEPVGSRANLESPSA